MTRAGVPALIVGIVLSIKPEIITGTLETTGAMLRVGALLLGWLVFSFLIRRFVRPPALRTGLIAVVGLGLLAMTVLPYFIDTRANDMLLTGPPTASTQGTPVAPGAGASEIPPAKAVKVIKKALASRKKVSLSVTVTARDSAGNATTATRKITLKK